ncbi:hypothetical protein ABWL39_06465 [Chitinivorax sp. PXF-14]|uniref:hypothetical protein n=1 Tax=Chitinivorax sp. PXF-14 TaxID=3230488 RepID=UPI0034651653
MNRRLSGGEAVLRGRQPGRSRLASPNVARMQRSGIRGNTRYLDSKPVDMATARRPPDYALRLHPGYTFLAKQLNFENIANLD